MRHVLQSYVQLFRKKKGCVGDKVDIRSIRGWGRRETGWLSAWVDSSWRFDVGGWRASASRGCRGEKARKSRFQGCTSASNEGGERRVAGVALGAATSKEHMEPTRVPRGPTSRLIFLFVTLVLTFAGKEPRRTAPRPKRDWHPYRTVRSVEINAVSLATYISKKLVRKIYLTRKLRTKLHSPELFGSDRTITRKLFNLPASFFSERKLYYETGFNGKISNSITASSFVVSQQRVSCAAR